MGQARMIVLDISDRRNLHMWPHAEGIDDDPRTRLDKPRRISVLDNADALVAALDTDGVEVLAISNGTREGFEFGPEGASNAFRVPRCLVLRGAE